MKKVISILCLGCFFTIGYYFSISSEQFPNATLVVEWPKATRDPAAINKFYDFSHLQGSALAYATKKRLLEGVHVVKVERDISVELGHFVIKGEDGRKEFACERFSKVILTFQGEGSAAAGELPEMEVEGQCQISNDINKMAAVWIPYSKISNEVVAEGEFDFRDDRPTRLKFKNVADRWPQIWKLKSVQLIDPSGSYADLSIMNQELETMMPKPLILEF